MDELYHYGVKGMRWGIRKRVEQSRVINATKRGSLVAAAVLTAALGKTAARSLSDSGKGGLAKAVKVGSRFAALYMASAAAIDTVRDFRNDQRSHISTELSEGGE